ncbi:hypothetical protein Tco_0430394, partial [Tanacetum coccineum]
AIMIEPEKPLKKKDQIELDEELAKEIEAEEQEELERIQKVRVAQEKASREVETDIQKESQKRPNQARDGKDKVNPKP